MDIIDSPHARLTAARHCMATVPVVADWEEQISAHLGDSPSRRAQLHALIAPHREALEQRQVELMVRHFTAAEITALTIFQASPTGRGIMKKLAGFQSELIPLLMPLLQSIVEAAVRGEGLVPVQAGESDPR